MAADGRVAKRLSSYWKLEIANAVFVPAAFVIISYQLGGGVGWPTFAALVPVIGLLIVGGLYWRGKLKVIEGDRAVLDSALQIADRWDRALLILTLAALALAAAGVVLAIPGSTAADRWAVLVAALLAAAEYVNYYHRQLQHFDHWPDFRRLITGRGFRPAKMAVDLAAWRARRGRARD